MKEEIEKRGLKGNITSLQFWKKVILRFSFFGNSQNY